MKISLREHNQPGFLFTLCGLDGCGKTTQITLLKEYFEEKGVSIMLTKQPTDVVRKSEIFRTYMDQPEHDNYEYRALSLLCASDRVQHSNKVILPWLEEGEIVISDRYFYSCLANLNARGYTEDIWIYDVSRSIPKPDGAFFLDVDVDTAVARVRSRPEEKTRYIDMKLQHRLREQYRKIAESSGGIIIDGTQTEEIVAKKIRAVVLNKLQLDNEVKI